MGHILEKIMIDLLGLIGGYPTFATGTSELTDLIRKLHPISLGRELIRLGPKDDGGYLVPDDLAGIEACFSPGVSSCSDFEKACADLGMHVFLADKSVDQPAVFHDKFTFIKKYIGATTSQDFITMDDWVATSLPGSTSDLLLQMDIEGYEYETFLSMSDRLLQRFRIIVVELHDLPRLWSRPYFSIVSHAFEKVLQTHSCVHIHPNNCCGSITKDGLEIPRIVEATFVRKDRIRNPSFATVFPHPLDRDNVAGPSLPLPSAWYRS